MNAAVKYMTATTMSITVGRMLKTRNIVIYVFTTAKDYCLLVYLLYKILNKEWIFYELYFLVLQPLFEYCLFYTIITVVAFNSGHKPFQPYLHYWNLNKPNSLPTRIAWWIFSKFHSNFKSRYSFQIYEYHIRKN